MKNVEIIIDTEHREKIKMTIKSCLETSYSALVSDAYITFEGAENYKIDVIDNTIKISKYKRYTIWQKIKFFIKYRIFGRLY